MNPKKALSLFVAITLMTVAVISMTSCDVEDIEGIIEEFIMPEYGDIDDREIQTNHFIERDEMLEATETAVKNSDEGEYGEPLESPPKLLLAEDYEMLISTIERNIELKISSGEIDDAASERHRLVSFKSYYIRFALSEAVDEAMYERYLNDYPILAVTDAIYVLDPAIGADNLPIQGAFMSEYYPSSGKFVERCYENIEETVRSSDADNKEELLQYVHEATN